MANLSDQTKLRITLGALATLLLASVGAAYTVGQRIASYDARLDAIETRAEWDAEGMSSVVTEMKALQDGLNTTNTNVTILSTQLETLLQQRTTTSAVHVTPARTSHTVVVAPSTPSQPQNGNPQQPSQPAPPQEQPEEPEPSLLQPAINPIQRLLDDIGRLL